MQEERDIGEGAEDKKAEDWKQKSKQAENDQQQQHPRERCPRCESFNTKFCYYNNYSLSQPRHYCKACKRYWTQGGTLRNVPVGGNCRKGKRAKTSSSAGENSRSDQQPPQPEHELQQNLTNPPAIITSDPVFASSPALMTTEPGNLISQYGASIHSTAPYFSGGGCNLSSLAAIQSLNNQPHSFSQALTYTRGGNLEGFSNLDLVHGRFTVPSFGSQQQQRQMQQRRQFYPMGNIDSNMEPLYFTGETWSHSSRQSFLNNTNAAMAADTTLWSNSTAATAAAAATVNANGNNINGASTSNPSQWPNLPGFGPPQWPSSANSWKLPQSP